MDYIRHFEHADYLVEHLNKMLPGVEDQVLKAKYVGFVSVTSVTVYELALKEIFVDFSSRKNKVFGSFAESYFSRLNGRIRIKNIKEEYLPRFGEKYQIRFERKMERRLQDFLQEKGRHFGNSYGNLISWRNEFAHQGRLNETATYEEVTQSYEDGKETIHILAETMVR